MTCPRCGAQMYKNFSLYYNDLWSCSACDYDEVKGGLNNPPVKNQFGKPTPYFHRHSINMKKLPPITLDDVLDFHEKLKGI